MVHVRQLVRRRRTVLIAAGTVLAVLVAALVVGFGSGGGTESDGAGVALGPARPAPIAGPTWYCGRAWTTFIANSRRGRAIWRQMLPPRATPWGRSNHSVNRACSHGNAFGAQG